MRELTKRCLSVLMVCAVVGAGTVGMVNLDQGPEPVQQYGPVQDSKAVAPVAAGLIAIAAGGYTASKFLDDDVNETKIRQADDKETHYQVYQTASAESDSADEMTSTINNWMTDASMIGRMEGQNAYIRALENDSSKSAAEAAATKAVNDWFAERQMRVIRNYEAQVVTYTTLWDTAASEANESWAQSHWTTQAAGGSYSYNMAGEMTNSTASLANGTSVDYMDYLGIQDGDKQAMDPLHTDGGRGGIDALDRDVVKAAPGSDYNQIIYADMSEWNSAWATIENKQSEAQTEVQNFIDATYDGYEQGTINASDLITPSLADRNYSPDGDAGTFTQQALTRMGYGLPTDFSDTDNMEIVADGSLYTGVLLSDGTPDGGFEVGKQYDVSNLTGKQVIQTSSGNYEIEESFTIEKRNYGNGTTQESGTISYTNPDYESADSIEGYKALMQNLSEQQALINARQERLLNNSGGGSGGLFDFDGLGASLPFGGAGIAAALGAIVVLGLVTRN